MYLAEKLKIVPVLRYGDLNAGATLDTGSINMKKCSRAMFVIQFHGIATSDSVLTVCSGATAGACTSPLTFHYAMGGAATGSADSDVIAADATSAALTIGYATDDNFMLLVEVKASDMDTLNNEEWLTLRITDGGSQTGNVTIFAILESFAQAARTTSVLV